MEPRRKVTKTEIHKLALALNATSVARCTSSRSRHALRGETPALNATVRTTSLRCAKPISREYALSTVTTVANPTARRSIG